MSRFAESSLKYHSILISGSQKTPKQQVGRVSRQPLVLALCSIYEIEVDVVLCLNSNKFLLVGRGAAAVAIITLGSAASTTLTPIDPVASVVSLVPLA